jgi:signal transduction histidine kinase
MAVQSSRFSDLPPSFLSARSLFWKVLLLVLVTTLIATVAIGFYLRYIFRDAYEGFLHEQLSSYIQLIAEQMGTPPDTSTARLIASTHPLDIRIESPAGSWSTDSTVASSRAVIEQGERTAFDGGDTLLVRIHESQMQTVLIHPDWTYVIRLRSTPEGWSQFVLPTLLLVVVLALLFTAAYLYVQHFLRPVGDLMSGVHEVGSGEFQYRVPVTSNDELGELAQAFNAMSEQIAAIIASKRRLLFDVSHELRTPLTRMNVALAMLPEGKAKLSLERNIRELNIMITELLENERLAVLGSKLVVEPVDVVAMARRIIETFGHDQSRIVFDSLTDSIEIVADSQRLQVAMRNVISNALKYSDDPVTVTVFPDDEGARMVVVDQGVGIPADAQEKVFEAFYRTDDSRSRQTGGYGLGLSLTKAIIDAHGGAIRLRSTPGEGTTISMWLPKAPSPDAVAHTVPSSAAQEVKEVKS